MSGQAQVETAAAMQPELRSLYASTRTADEWSNYVAKTSNEVRNALYRIVKQNEQDLHDRYLAYLASDDGIAGALTNEIARQEFSDVFMLWINELITLDCDSYDIFCEKQADVGRLMARAGMPPYALSRAMRKVKLWLIHYLARQPLSPTQIIDAVRFVIGMIDISVEIRETSYQSDSKTQARIEEAYRLHTLGQNLAMERERQRALLMEWAHRALSSFYRAVTPPQLRRLWKSEFGLWLNHKARVLFEATPELDSIIDAVGRIDEELVPGLEQGVYAERSVVSGLIGRIENELDVIKFALNTLFDSRLEMENGSDSLTRLLNRRFLPMVLKREIALQKKGLHQGFCVIVVDIDHFKRINDIHGHRGGDVTLKQVADLIINSTRPSDFVFRYGGEKFVLVLVDCDLAMAQIVAHRIRQNIEHMIVTLPEGRKLSLTASLGIAGFADELDYEVLLARADEAMYAAKAAGRNRVFVAAEMASPIERDG